MSLHQHAEAIAPKIWYELDMVRYGYARIQREWDAADTRWRNMLLEDFMLHARVLRAFFVDDPRRDDDVSARHFFDDSAPWETVAVGLCSYLKKHKKRLDKYMAHLTYSRLDEDKEWCDQIVFSELTAAWETFFAMLPPERQRWFQRGEGC
jgi:hypothetical protein